MPFWWVLIGELPNLLCSKCQRIDETAISIFFVCFNDSKPYKLEIFLYVLLSRWPNLTKELCQDIVFLIASWVVKGTFVLLFLSSSVSIRFSGISLRFLGCSTSDKLENICNLNFSRHQRTTQARFHTWIMFHRSTLYPPDEYVT